MRTLDLASLCMCSSCTGASRPVTRDRASYAPRYRPSGWGPHPS